MDADSTLAPETALESSESTVIDHVLRDLLLIGDEEIDFLKKKGPAKGLRRLRTAPENTLKKYLDDSGITDGDYEQIKQWQWYVKVHNPTPSEVMALTLEEWETMNPEELERQYLALPGSSPTVPHPSVETYIPASSTVTSESASELSSPPPIEPSPTSGVGSAIRSSIITATCKDSDKTKSDLETFLEIFRPIAENGDEGRQLRKQEWFYVDNNSSGHVSLAELSFWVKNKCISKLGDNFKGQQLFLRYRSSYVLAFNETKELYPDGDDDYINTKEFRACVACLCMYAAMHECFSSIDGSTKGITKEDDGRISREEWTNAHRALQNKKSCHGVDRVMFDLQEDLLEGASKVFEKIDTNGGGMVLLNEFCEHMKKNCINAETFAGGILKIREESNGSKYVFDDSDTRLSEASKIDIKKFLAVIRPFAAKGKDQRQMRAAEWDKHLDRLGMKKARQVDCVNWIKEKFMDSAYGHIEGRRLWRLFRPVYLVAYADAKIINEGDDDFLEPVEFRVFVANVCLYAVIYNCFVIDGQDLTPQEESPKNMNAELFQEIWNLQDPASALARNRQHDVSARGVDNFKEFNKIIKKFELAQMKELMEKL